jgi:nucleotide-binding universal stress UspA family protein
MIKDVVAIVEGGSEGLAAAEYGLAFAKLHHAHLNLTVVTRRAMLTALFDPLFTQTPDPATEAASSRDIAAIRDLVAKAPIECDVRGLNEEVNFIPGQADIQSRCTDLVLIGPQPHWSDWRLRRHIIDAVVVDAAAPTLLFPPGVAPEKIEHAVLGWNESVEAVRAARAVHAIIEPGGRVDVVVVEPLYSPDGHSKNPGEAIVDHFARHGLHTELHVCPRGGRPVAEVLESFAVMRQAKLLAVGAYAHSRFREMIFGGVTREMIAFQRLPILMVH